MSDVQCKNCNYTNGEIREIQQSRYLWKISNFRNIIDDISSPSFKRLGHSWRLKLVPAADQVPGEENGKVRVTLHLNKESDILENDAIKVCYELAIIDRGQSRTYEKSSVGEFKMKEKKGHGFDLLSRAQLLAQSVNLLPQEILTIRCTITAPTVEKLESSEFLSKLGEIFQQQKFGDVKIILHGGELMAYKGILASRSPVFEAMFSHTEFLENKTNEMDMADIDYGIFKVFLLFMYTNNVPSGFTKYEDLLKICHMYDVKELQTLCIEKCIRKLDVYNATEGLIVANQLDLLEMKNRIMDFIKANWAAYMETDGFDSLASDNLKIMKEILKYATTK